MPLDEITLPDGETRKLGNIIPTKSLSSEWTVYGTVPQTPLIPRDQWKPLIDKMGTGPEIDWLPPIHDQNGVGQCNAEATVEFLEAARHRQGLPYVRLSAADLYDRINWGRDGGSLLEDAIREMMTNGVGTAATSGELWKRGSFKGPSSPAERAKFKLLEAYLCPTFEHKMSASLSGFFGVSGVLWYDNYMPGADGWLPPGRGQSGGHAILDFKPTYRVVSGSIQYGIWCRQSWGQSWFPKFDNNFVLSEDAFKGPVGGWWCGRSVTDEGGILPTPIN